ncbi:MAG TPA: V-type ATP synthase subunit F [archaeon]|nr:V-type ATP synthase subunit F [archaeon]
MDGKHSIAVVADSPTCTGFRLAGIEKVFAREGKQAEEKIEQLLEDQEVGIIVTSELVNSSLDWRLKKKIERLAKPVVIAIPGKEGPQKTEGDSLRNMVKKALGFELMK